MEAKAKPAELGDDRWSFWKFWNGIKTVAGDTWAGVKDVAGFAIDALLKFGYTPLDAVRAYNEFILPQNRWERFENKALDSASGIIDSVGNAVAKASTGVGKAVGTAVNTVMNSNADSAAGTTANTIANTAAASTAGRSWNPFRLFGRGKGYSKRKARFKKGSPEAKAYMARLRAMRRKKNKFY